MLHADLTSGTGERYAQNAPERGYRNDDGRRNCTRVVVS